MQKRTLTVAGAVAGLTMFATLSTAPRLVAQDETPTTTSVSVAQDTTLPRELKPLFKGINLTPDQARQVAEIHQRHSGMGAGAGQDTSAMGQDSANVGQDSALVGQDSAGMGAGAGGEHQQVMFDEIRALLTSADQQLFNQNLTTWQAKKGKHGEKSDTSSYGGEQDSTSKWNEPSHDTTQTAQPAPSDSTRDQ